MNHRFLQYLMAFALTLGGAGCADSSSSTPDASSMAHLGDEFAHEVLDAGARLGAHIHVVDQDRGTAVVHLDYQRADDQPGARMAELYLEHSDNLEFVGLTPGQASLDAQKAVVGQAKASGRVRVIIYSASNAETLGSGRLASLQFTIVGQGPLDVALSTEGQLFAPPDANGGLLVSDPQSIAQGE